MGHSNALFQIHTKIISEKNQRQHLIHRGNKKNSRWSKKKKPARHKLLTVIYSLWENNNSRGLFLKTIKLLNVCASVTFGPGGNIFSSIIFLASLRISYEYAICRNYCASLTTVWCNQMGTVFAEMSSRTALTWYKVMKIAFKTKIMRSDFFLVYLLWSF